MAPPGATHRYCLRLAARLAGTVVFAVFAPADADAQNEPFERFRALIALYREAPDKAVTALAGIDEKAFDESMQPCFDAVAGAAGDCPPQMRLAAGMLNTEAAARLVGNALRRAQHRISVAQRLLDRLPVEHATFVARWYELAAQVFLFEGWIADAAALADDGLRRFVDAPRLFLVRGTIEETRVTMAFDDPRNRASARDELPPQARRGLARAIQQYRRALALEPALTAARLRLGWALFLAGDTRAATELAQVSRDSTSRDERYLARMFLGAAAERNKQPAAALEHYAAAREQDGGAQTACLAVSRTEDELGRAARARSIGLECLAMKKTRDPWWSYEFGEVDRETLRWLRSEARKP